jgi:superfamily I DNA/RNA helicase
MYRRHSQSTALEAALLARKIPYSVVGGTGVTDRKEVRTRKYALELSSPVPVIMYLLWYFPYI